MTEFKGRDFEQILSALKLELRKAEGVSDLDVRAKLSREAAEAAFKALGDSPDWDQVAVIAAEFAQYSGSRLADSFPTAAEIRQAMDDAALLLESTVPDGHVATREVRPYISSAGVGMSLSHGSLRTDGESIVGSSLRMAQLEPFIIRNRDGGGSVERAMGGVASSQVAPSPRAAADGLIDVVTDGRV